MVTFDTALTMAQMAITTTTPYQNARACALASTMYWESSSTSPRKAAACVLLEKSTPVVLSAVPIAGLPPIVMVSLISMLAGACCTARERGSPPVALWLDCNTPGYEEVPKTTAHTACRGVMIILFAGIGALGTLLGSAGKQKILEDNGGKVMCDSRSRAEGGMEGKDWIDM